MIGLLNVPADNTFGLTGQEAELIRTLQQSLARLGPALRIDLVLTTEAGMGAVFLQDGLPMPGDTVRLVACPQKEQFSVGFKPGTSLTVRFAPMAGVRETLQALVGETGERLEAERREEQLLEEVAANWESLDALHEISTDLFRSGDTKEAVQRLINRLGAFKAGLQAVAYLVGGGRLEPLATTAPASGSVSLLDIGPLEQVIAGKRALVFNHLGSTGSRERFAGTPWRRATSLAAAPLMLRSEVIGCVAVWLEDDTLAFDTPFARLVETLSHSASLLMECDSLTKRVRENERLAQDIEIASFIQETMLGGELPAQLPGIEFAAFSVPSQRIDGDFFEFYPLKDGSVDLLIGDVMGKGVAAALVGVAVKRWFSRVLADEAGASEDGALEPANIVLRAALKLNKRLVDLERFVTLCFARFHLPSRELQFVDCGHASTILHRRSTGESFLLKGEDLPLGVQYTGKYVQQSVRLQPGDTFLFYSDGVTENQNAEGEFFGEGRLMESVATWSSLGPEILIQQIRKEAGWFCGRTSFSDDFTCIAVRIALVRGEPVKRRSIVFPCELGILEEARAWLDQMAAAVPGDGLAEEALSRLQLACGEALDNCIVHGARHPCSGPVQLTSWAYAGSVTVELRHRGPAFDPFAVPPPSFDGSRDSGFGLFIISNTADELAYQREPDGTNVITISIQQRQEHPAT